MNWKNLKINKCPKCDGDFLKGFSQETNASYEKVFKHNCGFSIRESRYREIVNSQVTADLEKKWEQEYEK